MACKTAGGIDSSNVIVIIDPAPVVGTITPPPPPIYYNTEQNAEYTATCPEGQVGEPSIGYGTTPAGTYSSAISQEQADALAYAAALAIATEQANAGLVCYLATEWLEPISVPGRIYWNRQTGYPSGTTSTETINSFTLGLISPIEAYLQSYCNLDPSLAGPYSSVEFDFDYACTQSTRVYGANIGGEIIGIINGTGHADFVFDKVAANFGFALLASPVLMGSISVTNFRYRYRN